ncbi:MAG: molybdopterin converting factor subunit 1 [Pseudomonadota bacterium]
MIKVLFFAQLREQLQCGELMVAEANVKTITQLRDFLIAQYPQWAGFLSNEKLLIALNQTVVKVSQGVQSGDEVAFFPPVTGG